MGDTLGNDITGVRSRPLLWAAFGAVHCVVVTLALGGRLGIFDVEHVYLEWARTVVGTGAWPGLDVPFVYPFLALLPMLASAAFGWAHFTAVWFALMVAVNAAAFAVVLGRGRLTTSRALAALAWMLLILAAGPVSLARIDTVAAAVAVVALLLGVTRPGAAAALAAVGAWIKVWPAALVIAIVIACRRRTAALGAALLAGLGVLAALLALGAGANAWSFVSSQASRGLQIEAPAATPFMIAAMLASGQGPSYNAQLQTSEFASTLAQSVARASDLLLAAAVLAVSLVALLAVRRGAPARRLLPSVSLALVLSLIVLNKVGSPQFVTWVAAPLVLGLIARRHDFRAAAWLVFAAALLTQAVFPWLSEQVASAEPVGALVLLARNATYVALWIWALVRLARDATPRSNMRSNGFPRSMAM